MDNSAELNWTEVSQALLRRLCRERDVLCIALLR